MEIRLLEVDESFPEAVLATSNKYQVWFLCDRKLPESLARRCEFPNRAILERTIKTLISSNADYKANPEDFYFKHISDQVWDDMQSMLYVKYLSGNDVVEFKDYAH